MPKYHYYPSMNKLKLFPILFFILFNTTATHAEMYKWVDKDGNISYSDQPPFKGAEKLDAPALTSVPATDIPEKKPEPIPESEEDKNKTTKYTYLRITSPEHDATIRDNDGNFSISFSIQPSLNTKQGHYFSVHMDGKTMQDKLSSLSADMTNIDRGSHSLSVTVKDKNGKTIRKSKPITVHVHRQSILKKQPR